MKKLMLENAHLERKLEVKLQFKRFKRDANDASVARGGDDGYFSLLIYIMFVVIFCF